MSVAVPVAVILVPERVLKNILERLATVAAKLVKKPLVEVALVVVLFTAMVLEAFKLFTKAEVAKLLVVVAFTAVVLEALIEVAKREVAKALVVVELVILALVKVAVPVAVILVPERVLKNILERLATVAAKLAKKPLVLVAFVTSWFVDTKFVDVAFVKTLLRT